MDDADRALVLQEFLTEAEEQLDTLEEILVDLEGRPHDQDTLQTLFRAAHTFKGNASVVGLQGIVELAHVVEDVIERLLERTLSVTGDLVSLLLEAVDGLRKMIPAAVKGVHEPQAAHQALLKWLKQEAPAPGDAPSTASAQPKTAGGEGSESGERQRGRSLRVDVGKLDRMLNLLGEIAIGRERLGSLLSASDGSAALSHIRDAHHDSDQLFMELQEQIMKVRMVPVGPLFRQHGRMVRDLALSHGKQARLVVEGEDVELDTAVIERIRDPLVHMIRNAVDHGIEPAEHRRQSGKPAEGCLTLRARHDSGRVLIQLSDDGAGFNRELILARARSTGALGPAEQPPDAELFKLVFAPGFSTAEVVTDVSGRGMGMDVVKRNVEALRGTVSVESRAGEGATITLGLPLTLAIIEGFSVGVGNETFVLPLESVVECVELPPEEREAGRSRGVLSLRGKPLPYLRLRNLFSVAGGERERESVVVIHYDGGQAGLAVDVLHGEAQTVIKPLPRPVHSVRGISGAALQGNGRVALILDVPGLLREALDPVSALSRGEMAAEERNT